MFIKKVLKLRLFEEVFLLWFLILNWKFLEEVWGYNDRFGVESIIVYCIFLCLYRWNKRKVKYFGRYGKRGKLKNI